MKDYKYYGQKKKVVTITEQCLDIGDGCISCSYILWHDLTSTDGIMASVKHIAQKGLWIILSCNQEKIMSLKTRFA